MTRKERLISMIISKRLKKYGSVLKLGNTYETLRKPIRFAGLLHTRTQQAGEPGKDEPVPLSADAPLPESDA